MNPVHELITKGDLDAAITEVQAQVRKSPAEPKHHLLLFQLLAVAGQWSRALDQLAILEQLDPTMVGMVQTYRTALKCELFRASVFQGKHTPLFLGEPAEWIALLVQALPLVASGKHQEAAGLRAKAFEMAPTSPGSIDGKEFQWLADADPRLGPILEAVVNGKYYWIPFSNLSSIQIEKPTDLRDLVWISAVISLVNGGETVALLPVRYPGSETSADSAIRFARKTEWAGQDPDSVLGLGQRMLATDSNEYPLLDTRSIKLTSPS